MATPPRIAIVIDLEWVLKHHHDVFAGTQRYANEKGWESIVWPHAPADLIHGKANCYDGIIGRVTPQLAALAKQKNIPIVNVWANSPVLDVPKVSINRYMTGQWAAEHLMARGITRFGFIGYTRISTTKALEKGMRDTIKSVSGSFSRILVSASYSNTSETWQRFRETLHDWAVTWEPPIGIFTFNDQIGRYVANMAKEIGLRVPADVAIVSIGNELGVCLNPEPTLTSIENSFLQLGYQAAEILDGMMQGKTRPTETVFLPPSVLVPRASTDAFHVDDPIVSEALKFILTNSHKPLKVEDIVDQVPVSLRSLERRFRKFRNCTITEEVSRLRVERAKRLLIETDMLVKQIATACGFRDSTLFGKAFVRQEKITPSEYRRQRTGE